jgi:hypothetical protein
MVLALRFLLVEWRVSLGEYILKRPGQTSVLLVLLECCNPGPCTIYPVGTLSLAPILCLLPGSDGVAGRHIPKHDGRPEPTGTSRGWDQELTFEVLVYMVNRRV